MTLQQPKPSTPTPSKRQEKYAYTARNAEGSISSGFIVADGVTAAASRLQVMGYSPLTIEPAKKAGAGGRKKKVKAKDLAMFARQFGTMLDAGLPIVRAVKAISEQTEQPTFKYVLPLIQNDLEKGESLSVAMAKHPNVFPPLMIGMVKAGEASGSLPASLETVAAQYTKEAHLRSKIISAMMYPTIVMALAVVMVSGMLLFVVPRFAETFATLGGELPLPTKALIFMSNILKFLAPVAIVGGIAFIAWWKRHKNDRKVREFVDPLKLRLPVMGKFIHKIVMARFSRSFASLMDAGVPTLQALDIVSGTVGSIVVGDALQKVRSDVATGKTLSEPLSEFPVFPPLVTQMVSTGEETGDMPRMLNKVADFYEREVETASEALASTLEPIMIIMLGGTIGGMVIALYLPMFKIFDLIK